MLTKAHVKLLHRRLLAFGLPADYAGRCVAESVALRRHWERNNVVPPSSLSLFNLRRAQYCAKRYTARWGLGKALPQN